MSYKDKVKHMILLQNVLIAVLLLSLIAVVYYQTRPKIIQVASLVDECQPIGGIISHSIDDEGACENACRAACGSQDKGYHGVTFDYNPVRAPNSTEPPCYSCDCFCKE